MPPQGSTCYHSYAPNAWLDPFGNSSTRAVPKATSTKGPSAATVLWYIFYGWRMQSTTQQADRTDHMSKSTARVSVDGKSPSLCVAIRGACTHQPGSCTRVGIRLARDSEQNESFSVKLIPFKQFDQFQIASITNNYSSHLFTFLVTY
jgi:hypothetical protein